MLQFSVVKTRITIVLTVRLFECSKNQFEHLLGLEQHVVIPEAHHAKAEFFKFRRSSPIVVYLRRLVVSSTVYFDC